MTFWVALFAAISCAICNGVAAVLQKEGADTQKRATSLDAGLLVRLLQDWRYSLGIVLDITAGGFILIAVHSLPLFLTQSIVASSVAVTFVVERFALRRNTVKGFRALLAVLSGLVLLACTATPEQATVVSEQTRFLIAAAVVPVALVGALCARSKKPWSANALAVLSGVAFGSTSISGRGLVVPDPFWHILANPLFYSFGLYGLLGILLFTIGLQRTSATALNTVMVITQTIVPSVVGIFVFDDSVRQGLWWVAASGSTLTLVGAVWIARTNSPGRAQAKPHIHA